MKHAARSLLLMAAWCCPCVQAAADPSGPDQVRVPAGTYIPFLRIAAGPDQIPVRSFFLDTSPITRGEFLDFVRDHPTWRKSRIKRLFGESSYLRDWHDDLDPGTGLDEPVTYVSWFAARAYCEAHSKRLPTIAEWERAAGSDSRVITPPPERHIATPVGFAMGVPAPDLPPPRLNVGEVWEWNLDFNSALVSGRASSSGTASSLFCGDGYRARNADDYAAFLRYSLRSSLRADYALRNLGFRCAL
ncbi:MAG TPA: formylglycine-generating enzyme family protein [Povalibacter sp.]|nr:formylglycine-generating enzyme family protein [Povalibacter sp.]